MVQLIERIFGKPYSDSKLLVFGYWFGILFYVIALFLFTIHATIGGQWFSVLTIAIGFPFLFRMVYHLNTSLWKKYKGLSKRTLIILSAVSGFLVVIFVGSTLFFADNVTINANKSVYNGNVIVSIGSLKGSFALGNIDFYADRGHYEIKLYTETAKDVNVELFFQ